MMEQMGKQIKMGTWIIGTVAVAVLAYAGVIYARAYSQSIEPASFRSFSVSGEGKVTAIPDMAEFSFGIITQGGKDIAEAQKQNTEKMNVLVGFIKSQGVANEDIKTQQFSIEPRYQYYDCSQRMVLSSGTGPTPCPPPDIVGYTITQSALVKVRDFAKIGGIMGELSQKGANSVSQLTFTIDDKTRIENDAREKAIRQAQEKARLIARTGDFRIGKLLTITENVYRPIPMYRDAVSEQRVKTVSMEAAPVAPSIEPGSQEVSITVYLNYEIR